MPTLNDLEAIGAHLLRDLPASTCSHYQVCYTLYLISDCYLGMDQQYDIEFIVRCDSNDVQEDYVEDIEGMAKDRIDVSYDQNFPDLLKKPEKAEE